MEELYDFVESTLIWGAVIFAIGFVAYLAYRQHLKAKYRRLRRRRRSRRALKHERRAAAQHQPDQSPLDSFQASTKA